MHTPVKRAVYVSHPHHVHESVDRRISFCFDPLTKFKRRHLPRSNAQQTVEVRLRHLTEL